MGQEGEVWQTEESGHSSICALSQRPHGWPEERPCIFSYMVCTCVDITSEELTKHVLQTRLSSWLVLVIISSNFSRSSATNRGVAITWPDHQLPKLIKLARNFFMTGDFSTRVISVATGRNCKLHNILARVRTAKDCRSKTEERDSESLAVDGERDSLVCVCVLARGCAHTSPSVSLWSKR